MNSKNNKNKTLRGYVHNEKFGPYCMPVVFQNKLLKQYCDERKLNFALPQGEIVFQTSCNRSLIEKLKHNEGIVMMSVFMLPQKAKKEIKSFLIL